MCGRISLAGTKEHLEARFKVKAPDYKPNYNAAPTQVLPVILDASPQVVTMCRWGLIPSWAKDENIGYKMINARAETVQEKPAYANLFKKNRCLVIADGFYEWKKERVGKTPYRITLKDGEFFAMAGLWSSWVRDGKEQRSFSIITTKANPQMAKLHDRMPVILQMESERDWLLVDINKASQMLRPFTGNLGMYEVSALVNSPRNNSVEVIREVDHI